MMEISPFDEMLRHDMDFILFNSRELAKPHTVNGIELLAIIDNSKLEKMKSSPKYADGYIEANLLILLKAIDLPGRPTQSGHLNLDGKTYRVLKVEGEQILEIYLGASKS